MMELPEILIRGKNISKDVPRTKEIILINTAITIISTWSVYRNSNKYEDMDISPFNIYIKLLSLEHKNTL